MIPAPFGASVKLTSVDEPTAASSRPPVPFLNSKLSAAVEDVSVNTAIAVSFGPKISTLPSVAPPRPPLMITEPEINELEPLPPLRIRSPASPADESPPATVRSVSSSPCRSASPESPTRKTSPPSCPCRYKSTIPELAAFLAVTVTRPVPFVTSKYSPVPDAMLDVLIVARPVELRSVPTYS